jgi:hypothetical protein
MTSLATMGFRRSCPDAIEAARGFVAALLRTGARPPGPCAENGVKTFDRGSRSPPTANTTVKRGTSANGMQVHA